MTAPITTDPPPDLDALEELRARVAFDVHKGVEGADARLAAVNQAIDEAQAEIECRAAVERGRALKEAEAAEAAAQAETDAVIAELAAIEQDQLKVAVNIDRGVSLLENSVGEFRQLTLRAGALYDRLRERDSGRWPTRAMARPAQAVEAKLGRVVELATHGRAPNLPVWLRQAGRVRDITVHTFEPIDTYLKERHDD